MNRHAYDARIERDFRSFLAEVAELCALPSVSAKDERLPETAAWVRARLERAGFRAQEFSVAGSPPAIWAEAGEGPRTLLFYNHYDVQPAEPLDLWESDPFTLTERDGRLYARGVADNKADLLSRIHAVETWRATQGPLPLRVRWLVEGEEEVGSIHLGELADRHGDRWKADGCAWEGSGHDDRDRPLIYCGAKGMVYLQLRVKTLDRDLHSMYGGIVPNAAWRLVQALATLRDADGRLTVDGLREHVRPFTDQERAAVAKLSFDARKEAATLGAPYLLRGLDRQAALEELLNAPTANIAGLWSGYTGPGSKTIVPAEAQAKMDFRLVPDLTAAGAHRLIVEHLRRRGFDDVEVTRLSGQDPARTPVDHPIVVAAAAAWRDLGAQEPAIYPTMAATGPIGVTITKLGVPTVMTGGVLRPDDRIHSPNENIRPGDYATALRYWGCYLERFAAI